MLQLDFRLLFGKKIGGGDDKRTDSERFIKQIEKESLNQRLTLKKQFTGPQLVTCLAPDACLTAYPGVASLIPARSHTFVRLIMK